MGASLGIKAWVTLLSCNWADRAAGRRLRSRPGSWPICLNEFSSGHCPASGIGGHNCGCRVDGPLNLPHNRLWVVPNSRWEGSRNSLSNTRLAGIKPKLSWVIILQAKRKSDNLASQSLWCDAMTFRRCSSNVWMYRSIIPSNCGCTAVVGVLLTPKHCKTFYITRDSKLRPWSLCSSRGTQNQQKFANSASATDETSIRNGIGFRPLGKIVHSDQEVLVSMVASWKGPATLMIILLNKTPILY
jgi:hypothetical protein